MTKMLHSLSILLWSGILCFTVLCSEPSATLTRTSYARGDEYGCSEKFFEHHCWKYCTGSSGKWCYTVKSSSNHCTSDHDCRWSSACQGWCAWNSQSGCSKACHEEVVQPQQQSRPQCGRGRPWWQCQSSYGGGWRSGGSSGGKWISPDVPNDLVMNGTANSITFNGNIVTVTKSNGDVPQSALWYPVDQIKSTTTTLYWTFTIRETGTSSASSNVAIGLSDLNKIASGWGVRGLFYNPNLSDGSRLLIGDFGPKLKNGDKCSILVKLVDDRMKVYIILNDKSLGLAFDVPEKTLDGIYPAVKFTGEGFAVEIVESLVSDAPTELEPVRPLVIEGNWTLHALGKRAVLTTPVVTMKIAEIYDRVYSHAYRLRIHAVNKFIGTLTERSKSDWVGEISDKTAKQGTASEMELETEISKHITGIRNIVLDAVKRELRMESVDSTSVWRINEPKQTHVNSNPFKKTNN